MTVDLIVQWGGVGMLSGIMKKKYPVILSETEREELKRLIAAGTAPARKLTHARILLKADQSPEGPGRVDEQVAEAVETSQPTVARVRKQYFEEGLEAALKQTSAQPGVPPKAGRRAGGTASRACLQRDTRRPSPLEFAATGRQAGGA